MASAPDPAVRGGGALHRLGMREIARRAGVSPITVSRALSDPARVATETRARILAVIDEAGFIPNRVAGSLRGPTRMIGTIVPPLINGGIAEQVQGMSDACLAAGYELMLVQGEFSEAAEERAIRTMLGWQPSGLIIQAFVQGRDARRLLKAAGIPLVEVSEIRGRRPLDMAVGVSNFAATHAMTTWLVQRGYRRLGFVATPAHGNDRQLQRPVGYRQAMADLGLEPLEVTVPMTAGGGAEALDLLARRAPGLQAIFCASDTLAIGAIQECHRRGWPVPERLAIAGYGDSDLAPGIHPAITTVRIDRYGMGRIAVERLLGRIAGTPRVKAVTDLGYAIVERQSA